MNNKTAPIPYPDNLLRDLGVEHPSDDQRRGLEHVLSSLTEWEQEVLELYDRDGMTFAAIAEMYGITAQRVRAIRTKAIRKLKGPERIAYIVEGFQGVRQREEEEKEQAGKRTETIIAEAEEKTGIADLGAIPVSDMGLSKRIVTQLERNDVETLCDLVDIVVNRHGEFVQIRNIGEGLRKEIFGKLREYGVELEE